MQIGRALLILVFVVGCRGSVASPNADMARPHTMSPPIGADRDAELTAGDDSGLSADAATEAGPGHDGSGLDPKPDASVAPGTACPQLGLEEGADVSGFKSDVYTWHDVRCQPRSAAMVRNDQTDPAGKWGGYLRRYTYETEAGTRTCVGSHNAHPGFGYVVSHWGNSGTIGHETEGTREIALSGRHHAIHRYRWPSMSIGGHSVAVTIQWLFATGRDHPLWAITYDLQNVSANALEADTRSPYGDLQWDGGEDAPVAGVGWGDRYRFVSLSSPISLSSGWDYTEPNLIPYAMEWTQDPDAEMGLVQTQTWSQHDAGGYWNYSNWGTRDDDGPMPDDWNWTYQLNQYELAFTNRSKRLAWGSNYGAVGKTDYPAYGDDRQLSGWPYQSYAVFVVLGKHSEAAVLETVEDLEAVQAVTLTASEGSVVLQGPAGAGRTDTALYAPAGWDPVHAAWTIQTASGRASLSIETGPKSISQPLFHVLGASNTSPVIELDGRTLAPDVDYYASVDAANDSLWITLASKLAGDHTMSIR